MDCEEVESTNAVQLELELNWTCTWQKKEKWGTIVAFSIKGRTLSVWEGVNQFTGQENETVERKSLKTKHKRKELTNLILTIVKCACRPLKRFGVTCQFIVSSLIRES